MSSVHSISSLFSGDVPTGETVTIRGWVRTRRDSKAGLSFVNVHDGSCFAALQVIAMNTIENYDEVQRLTTGCAIECEGELVPSQGKGQSVELSAARVTVVGWVDDPETYPVPMKRHTREYLREVAHLRMRTNLFGAVTRVRNCLAQAVHRYFHDHGFYWIHTPIITASDAEGAGELFRVSTLDMTNVPRTDSGAVDFSQDFFWQGILPYGVGSAKRRNLLHGNEQGVYLRPHFSRRKLAYKPASCGVLDDRAGDRVCGSS